MSDWLSNDMMSHSNFKTSFSERRCELVRGFLFEFGVIWEILLSGVIT